jgi:hypothetical protein
LRYEYDRIKTQKNARNNNKGNNESNGENMRNLQVENLRGSVIVVVRLDTEQMHVGSKIQVRNLIEAAAVEAVVNSSKVVPVKTGTIKVVLEAKVDEVAGALVVPVIIVRRSAIISKIVIKRKEMRVAKQQQQLLVTITTTIIVVITGAVYLKVLDQVQYLVSPHGWFHLVQGQVPTHECVPVRTQRQTSHEG